ncbi:MAG: hypothetical protein KAR32_01200, partial [Candidatus Omnitrophica bacterium]|nr:hypothetical protein [Candidatus Omnitrophota bacterium]
MLLIVLIHIPLKVYLLSGIYGALTEIVSEEHMTFHWRSVHRNAKEYWSCYLFLSAVPVLIYYALYSSFPELKIPLEFVTSHLDIL